MCCTPADHKAAVHAFLHEDAIRVRDYNNLMQHLLAYFVANRELLRSADLHVTRDVSSQIVSLPVQVGIASDDAARVVAAAQ